LATAIQPQSLLSLRRLQVLLVVNAHASGVRTELVESVRRELARLGAGIDTLVTESADEWVEAIAGDAERRVVLIGGDGTLHAVANMAGACPEIALVPAGRANNVARSLGIPVEPGAAVRLALEGRVRPIDLIQAVTPSRRYVTVEGISVGFLAQARSRYHAANSGHRPTAIASGAQALAHFHPLPVRVTRGEAVEQLALSQLFVANLPLYGFKLHVAPQADPTDELLDFVGIEGRGRLGVLPMVVRLLRATELDDAGVHLWRAARGRITTDGCSPIVADSVNLGPGPVEVYALPRALPLVRP
jgi:diacylglycerol kinase (ATP)